MQPNQARSRIYSGGALAFLVWVLSPWGLFSQYWNLIFAERHAPQIREVLGRHPEFASIKVGIATGGGGTLAVFGMIPRAELQERLRTTVEDTRPPVKVRYFLRVPAERPGETRKLPTTTFDPTKRR